MRSLYLCWKNLSEPNSECRELGIIAVSLSILKTDDANDFYSIIYVSELPKSYSNFIAFTHCAYAPPILKKPFSNAISEAQSSFVPMELIQNEHSLHVSLIILPT